MFQIQTYSVEDFKEVCTIKHILVVEDNSENLDLVLCLLENKGYKLKAATDGEKAMEFVNDHRFDLIILDILLPKVDGFEVLKRLINTQNSNTPVIAVTACYMTDEKKAFLLEKCAGYLSKPFSIHQFYETVSFNLADSVPIKSGSEIFLLNK